MNFATALVRKASRLAFARRHNGLSARKKADGSDVTDADELVEEMIRSQVRQTFPKDSVVGEEGGGVLGDGRTWVIDPIDGTSAFLAGFPAWATLIGFACDGKLVVGVVDSPELDLHVRASAGGGAWLNGSQIGVSQTKDFNHAHIAFGGDHHPEGAARRLVARANAAGKFALARRSDFLGHVHVACGLRDGMVEGMMRVWDYAALVPILEEAGGKMTASDGSGLTDGCSVVSSNGRIHDQLVQAVS